LPATGRLIEGTAGGPLTQAARDYDRAARERYGQLPVATAAGGLLRAAALQLARASRRPGRTEAAHVALLITQITRLSLAVARLREAQGRTEQAAAARRATRTMRTAAGHWDSETAQFLTAQQPSAAATTARAALPAAVTTPNSLPRARVQLTAHHPGKLSAVCDGLRHRPCIGLSALVAKSGSRGKIQDRCLRCVVVCGSAVTSARVGVLVGLGERLG